MTRAPIMLELFSGSKAMSDTAQSLGFRTVTLDNDERNTPDIHANILDWNYHDRTWGTFDVLHASIPCEQFSQCNTSGRPHIEAARAVARRTREIIDYFRRHNPKMIVVIENPKTSLLNNEKEVIKGFHITDASYCCYGYPYRKDTRFFHNIPGLALSECANDGKCFWAREHPMNVQSCPDAMRAVIPKCLCFSIIAAACRALGGYTVARLPLRATFRLPRSIEKCTRRKDCGIEEEIHSEIDSSRGEAAPSAPPRIAERKSGRPPLDRTGLECASCKTQTPGSRWYGLSRPPLLCSRCYRKGKGKMFETGNGAAEEEEEDASDNGTSEGHRGTADKIPLSSSRRHDGDAGQGVCSSIAAVRGLNLIDSQNSCKVLSVPNPYPSSRDCLASSLSSPDQSA